MGRLWKSYFEVFSGMIPFVIPKNFNLHRPPIHVFAHISKIFEKYQMQIFFIEYSGSLTPVITWFMFIWSKLS